MTAHEVTGSPPGLKPMKQVTVVVPDLGFTIKGPMICFLLVPYRTIYVFAWLSLVTSVLYSARCYETSALNQLMSTSYILRPISHLNAEEKKILNKHVVSIITGLTIEGVLSTRVWGSPPWLTRSGPWDGWDTLLLLDPVSMPCLPLLRRYDYILIDRSSPHGHRGTVTCSSSLPHRYHPVRNTTSSFVLHARFASYYRKGYVRGYIFDWEKMMRVLDTTEDDKEIVDKIDYCHRPRHQSNLLGETTCGW